MTWFAFHGGYATMDLAGVFEKEAVSLGFHGYGTQAQAEQNRNSVNFLQGTSLDTLETEYSALGGKNGLFGADSPVPTPASVISDAKSVVGFLGDLTQRSLWLRVLKVVVGVGLIITGIIHLTGAGKVAADAAGTAARAAVLA